MKKNKYISRYAYEKEVNPAQFIAELACANNARRLKKELPQQFWVLPEWKSYYLYQLILAYDLLKEFEDNVIVKALIDNQNIFSLKSPVLRTICSKLPKKPTKVVKSQVTESTFQTHIKKPSILDKLDD